MSQTSDAQIAIDNLHLADPAPQAPPSTLGQTPHEPTVRPWELELLISGALVFSMVQLPGQLDAWYTGVRPRLDTGWLMAAVMGWFYVKMALYALVGGFILHLAVRGYWVGVIGIEAVFPGGIRWERMRTGPIMRQVAVARTPSLQSLIDRADRLASMIFGGAFGLALMFVYSLAVGGAMVLGAVGLSRWVDNPMMALYIMEGVLFAFIGPLLVAGMVDRRMGDRLDPGGRPARIIRRLAELSARLSPSSLFMPLLYTLLTNLRERRHGATLALVIAVFMGAVLGKDVFLSGGAVRTDGFTYVPDGGAMAVLPAYYADQREGTPDDARLPQIQSDIIREPYVRLFIPYRPRRHTDLIERRCPDAARAVAAPNADGAAVLRCMAALQPVTLNGRPVQPAWRFYTQPGTGIRGMVAHIATAALPRGENVLVVAPLPPVEPDGDEKPGPPYRIPFWL
jgi:hypothetical protein